MHGTRWLSLIGLPLVSVRLSAGTRDVAAAAGVLFDGVADSGLQHRGQVELSRGVLAAMRRPLMGGQAFTWDRKAPGSSALLAASLALWGVDAAGVQDPRPPRPSRSYAF